MGKSTETLVNRIPKCDLCDEEARYNARTSFGPWAYLCEKHFKSHGIGLGMGYGQMLKLREKVKEEVTSVK